MGTSPSSPRNSRAPSGSSPASLAPGNPTTAAESPLLAATANRSPRNSNRRFSAASFSSLIRPSSPSLSGGSGSGLLGGGPSSPRRSLTTRFQLAVSEEKRKYKLGVVGFDHSGVEHFKYQCMRESGFESDMSDSRALVELIESQMQLFCDEVLPLLDESKEEHVCHFRDELEQTFGRVSLYTRLSDEERAKRISDAKSAGSTDSDDGPIAVESSAIAAAKIPSILTLFTKCLECTSVKTTLKSRAFNPRLSLAFIDYIKTSKMSERFDIASKSDFVPDIDDIRWFIAMENVVDVFEMQWRNHPLFFHEIKFSERKMKCVILHSYLCWINACLKPRIHRCKPIRYDHLHFFDDFNGFVFLSSAMGYRKYLSSNGGASVMIDAISVPSAVAAASSASPSDSTAIEESGDAGATDEHSDPDIAAKKDRELALVKDLNMFGQFLRKLQRFRVPSIVIVTDMHEFAESVVSYPMDQIAHLMPLRFPSTLNPTAVEDCQRYIHDNFKSKATLERYELYMHFHDLNRAVFAPLLEDITHSVVMRSLRRSGLI